MWRVSKESPDSNKREAQKLFNTVFPLQICAMFITQLMFLRKFKIDFFKPGIFIFCQIIKSLLMWHLFNICGMPMFGQITWEKNIIRSCPHCHLQWQDH